MTQYCISDCINQNCPYHTTHAPKTGESVVYRLFHLNCKEYKPITQAPNYSMIRENFKS